MDRLPEMDTPLTLWKYTLPKAKSFSHEVEEKGNQDTYFTCSHIRMIAVHPHKDGRYNQVVIQLGQGQRHFTVRLKQAQIINPSMHVGQNDISNSVPLDYG